jgi:DNA-binding XRE family transcriptional regulator
MTLKNWPDLSGASDKRHRLATLAEWVQKLYPSGQEPVLVGGAAVEIYAGPALTTGDLDLMGGVPDSVGRALSQAGFERHGREWLNESWQTLLEFRSADAATRELAVTVRVGNREVVCIGREALIVNRLASWSTWASPVDGMNAFYLFTRPRGATDAAKLDGLAKERGAQAALAELRSFASARSRTAGALERWAVETFEAKSGHSTRPHVPPPPRRRRPRAYLKWAALSRWGQLPPWEEFSAGYLLREARERVRRTQSDLAERLGVSQQAIAQAERWRSNPTVHFLRAWGEACGMELDLALRTSRED